MGGFVESIVAPVAQAVENVVTDVAQVIAPIDPIGATTVTAVSSIMTGSVGVLTGSASLDQAIDHVGEALADVSQPIEHSINAVGDTVDHALLALDQSGAVPIIVLVVIACMTSGASLAAEGAVMGGEVMTAEVMAGEYMATEFAAAELFGAEIGAEIGFDLGLELVADSVAEAALTDAFSMAALETNAMFGITEFSTLEELALADAQIASSMGAYDAAVMEMTTLTEGSAMTFNVSESTMRLALNVARSGGDVKKMAASYLGGLAGDFTGDLLGTGMGSDILSGVIASGAQAAAMGGDIKKSMYLSVLNQGVNVGFAPFAREAFDSVSGEISDAIGVAIPSLVPELAATFSTVALNAAVRGGDVKAAIQATAAGMLIDEFGDVMGSGFDSEMLGDLISAATRQALMGNSPQVTLRNTLREKGLAVGQRQITRAAIPAGQIYTMANGEPAVNQVDVDAAGNAVELQPETSKGGALTLLGVGALVLSTLG